MVERALKVLDVVRNSTAPVGVQEIARTCELNPSTAFRILKTLEKSQWVFQLADGSYVLGQKLGFLTEKRSLNLALREVALFVMRARTAELGPAMNLIVRDGSEGVIIQQSRTNSLVDYVPPLLSRVPLYATAGGKVLLAELPADLALRVLSTVELRPLTSHTITDRDALLATLRDIAERGYAFDDRETSESGFCISVPVRDHDGTTVAALSFSGIIGVSDPGELLKYLPALQDAAAEISRSLFDNWQW
ncbi:IclR family transcriptional regulator [Propionicimonas sp. T2.31MG-18]|uniref:IclR family transcriptional regulator n=1 Tax=Propionicimonas sp. T2.31MG-18 TaxID=3157620 RepID=UPI00366D3983